ncbi:restriction endonuclease subunit S [Bacteroides pyogenes]|uniref:restriction endonuclease subunit S n=1 Tax=Bacteroides pyogenes TaxID=310300 RepID=UPI002FD99DDD
MRLKEICDYISRGTTPDYVDDSPYKVMNQATFSKGWLDESNIRYTSKNASEAQIKKGDLLMASTGGGVLGKVFFFDSDDTSFYADSHVSILRNSKGKNMMKYLYYVFSIKYDEINATMVKGSTNQTELQRNYLLAYEIDIPSLSKQQRIVDYLDAKLGKIDARIAILEKQQDAYARLKRSVIHHAVTRGLNPNASLKDSGVKWIGLIPEHWELQRFKSIFTECKSVTETGQEDLLSVSEYYGVARRIDKMEDGEYESRADSLVSYKVCKKDDLVINIMLAWKRGLGFSDFDGIVSPAYAVYRGKNIAPHYFHYLMRTDMYVAEYKRNSKGIIDSRLRMYTDRFNNIMAIVPPLSEQQVIAAYLDEKCSKIDAATENIGKQIDALKRLKRALINEVVTGQRAV